MPRLIGTQRSGVAPAAAKSPVIINVRELLHETPDFGPDQIQQLIRAITGPSCADVRQQLHDLETRIGQGEASPRNLLVAGIASYFLARHAQAEAHLAQVSDSGVAKYHRALVSQALERYEEAAWMYEEAAREGYDPVHCALCRAGAVRLGGRVDVALDLLRANARDGAARAEYSYQMGCILADRGDTDGAIEYFERAVDMDPLHSGALFRLANLHSLLGNDDEAINLYERALSRPPFFVGAMVNLGLLYEDSERYAAAAYCFRRVLDVFPTHERARLFLRDIEASGEMYYDEDAVRRQKELDNLLATPLTDYELSARCRNCLEEVGIFTIGDLVRTTEPQLLANKNFGETSLREIREMLETCGLRLGQFADARRPAAFNFHLDDLPPEQRALLDLTVLELNLSVRARKCLTRLGIATVGDLVSKSADELMSVRNFGVTSLNEIRGKLAEKNLRLRNE